MKQNVSDNKHAKTKEVEKEQEDEELIKHVRPNYYFSLILLINTK